MNFDEQLKFRINNQFAIDEILLRDSILDEGIDAVLKILALEDFYLFFSVLHQLIVLHVTSHPVPEVLSQYGEALTRSLELEEQSAFAESYKKDAAELRKILVSLAIVQIIIAKL